MDREVEPQGFALGKGRGGEMQSSFPHPQSLVQKAFTNRSQLTSESNQHPSPDLNSPPKHACNQKTWKNSPTNVVCFGVFFSFFFYNKRKWKEKQRENKVGQNVESFTCKYLFQRKEFTTKAYSKTIFKKG